MSSSATVAEQAAAKAIVEGFDFFQKNYPKMDEAVKAIQAQMLALNGLKDFDPKTVLEEIQRVKANYDTLTKKIRSSKGGFYIPGLEDEAEKFSLVRAIFAIKSGNWKAAPFEEEVFKQARQKAGAVMGVDSQGGFFVPDQVIPEVISAIYVRSVLIDLNGDGQTRMSVIDGLVGGQVRIPKFLGGMIAYWLGEEDTYAESAAKVGNVTLSPRKMGLLTRITKEMQMFSGFGYEQLMRNDMGRAAAKKLDYTAIYGKGTDNEPRGLSKLKGINIFSAQERGIATTASTGAAVGGELDFDNLMEMQGIVEDQNLTIEPDWAFISAPRYFRRLQQLKVQFYTGQTSQQAYLLGVPMLTADKLKALIGDYDKTTQIPTAQHAGASLGWTSTGAGSANKFGDMVAGNWSEMLFGRWAGIEISDDGGVGTGFVKDETLVKFSIMGDFAARQEKALVFCPDVKMRT